MTECDQGATAPIRPGYAWSILIQSEPGTFPAGTRYRAQGRAVPSAPSALFTLTTEDGEIVPQGSDLALTIPAAKTAACAPGVVHLDIVRSDIDPPAHLNIYMVVNVMLSITRGS